MVRSACLPHANAHQGQGLKIKSEMTMKKSADNPNFRLVGVSMPGNIHMHRAITVQFSMRMLENCGVHDAQI